MQRIAQVQDPAVERIVIEDRPGNTLVLRIDWARGSSSTLRLSLSEANGVAEFLQEVAGFKLGNQDEFDEMTGPGIGGDDRPGLPEDGPGAARST